MRVNLNLLAPVVFAPEDGISDDHFAQELREQFNNDPEVDEALSQWLEGSLSSIGMLERLEYLRELAISRTYRVLEEAKEDHGRYG